MIDDAGNYPSPADFLRRRLEERGLSQRDLAFVLDVPEQSINQLVLGKRSISANMAKALGAALEVEPEYLLKLQKAAEVTAELSRARAPEAGVARKARMMATYPIREMIKRGWLESDKATLEMQVAQFFGASDVDALPHLLPHAARKSDYSSDMPPAQLAWLYRVKKIASEMVVPGYSERALREALVKLQALMTAPEETRHVHRILSECGVRFVIVESLPSAKIDGVCLWLRDGSAPVVGMSLRFDRIDNFWFVLRHELEHVLNRDGMAAPVLDAELEGEAAGTGEGIPEHERMANSAASDFCVPKAQMDSWIARKQPFFSERDLLGFAKRLQIHPGIVAGQLRNRTGNYRLFSKYLEKVRSSVALSGVVIDGWGQIAPVAF